MISKSVFQPKRTLRIDTSGAENGQEQTLVRNAVNQKMKFDMW